MTINSTLTMLKALIDISLVWILVYAVLKNLKNNVKMVMLLKGVLIIIIVKGHINILAALKYLSLLSWDCCITQS